ncbi:nuclear receptor coactivator 5 [Corythoichthys intestinalis]|uniref:nuclear receptor coactivator 5 n=1 Tax=Corythoichthys intestinalis TaxID=161448 RepID=UPI0025A50A0C|nr:nuclear receptor coactivator 5 [Corythoichthys intestinalis]
MSSWPKSSKASRRQQGNPNGSAQPLRFRSAPYNREQRTEDIKDALESYKELEQKQLYSGSQHDGAKHQPNAKPEMTPSERRKTLYQNFYKQVQEDRTVADCVIISLTNQCLDYPKSLNQCLQDRGLSVEMLYLQAESGLTKALQDVRGVGSPLCILVEQTNIALSSCTVIIFSESLKIHRNMPKDQAMDFVVAEHGRGVGKERMPRDPADIASQASQLLGDFLDREKIGRHVVPTEIRQSLQLLSEGVHVYSEELETILGYVRSRQEFLRASNDREQKCNILPSGLGKPPPLLPTPLEPPQCASEAGRPPLLDCTPPTPMPLLPSPGSFPKTKPPPLLSLHRPQSTHNLYGGPGLLCTPLMRPLPQRNQALRGSHSMRVAPPSLKSSRPPLLATPGVPPLSSPRH